MIAALQAEGLGKRYGDGWGLRECTFEVPPGSVVGLVGPNGAGKSTLIQLMIGLVSSSTGQIRVFGEPARANRAQTLARVGYVAQDHPLYPDFTVDDMLHLGRSMNPSWDQPLADKRMRALGIPTRRKIKDLSGGQQAQVSLAMALAKHAPLLILDEPVASLDPVARLEFMQALMAAVADTELTVVISSHVVSELERICDWVIVLTAGHLQLACSAESLVAEHRLLTGPRTNNDPIGTIHRTDSDRHSTAFVRISPDAPNHAPDWRSEQVGFEQVVLAYLQKPLATRDPGLAGTGPARGTVDKEAAR